MAATADKLASLRARIAAIESRPLSQEPDGDAARQNRSERVPVSGEEGAKQAKLPSLRSTAEGEDAERAAFNKVVKLVSQRDHAAEEIRRKLARANVDSKAAERAIERAVSCGVIDDIRFAGSFIRSKASQGKGRDGIVRSLRDLGISVDDVPGWPDEFFDEDAEIVRAIDVLRRNPPRSASRRDGAYRKLVSRGFSASVASSAARRWSEEVDEQLRSSHSTQG